MKAEKALPTATIFGLVALLVILAIVVQQAAPSTKTDAEKQQLLELHEGLMYFFDAVSMAKQVAPDPSLRWSHAMLDKRSGCILLGNGVWFASGTISGEGVNLPKPPTWEVFFVPGDELPLYVRVGNLGAGDGPSAVRRAGRAPGQAQGAPVEK